jgi:hypothetical protein
MHVPASRRPTSWPSGSPISPDSAYAASFPVFASYWKFLSSYIEDEKLYLLNLYLDKNGKIMFGSPDWTDSEFKIKRLVKRIG